MKNAILFILLLFSGVIYSQTCSGTVGGMGEGDDFDGDGYCNSIDFDDDNDGIKDRDEGHYCNFLYGEFDGTFGVINTVSERRDLQNPSFPNASGYFFSTDGIPEAKYIVTSNAAGGVTLWNQYMNPGNFVTGGHTTGAPNDAYLLVNGAPFQGIFYEQSINTSNALNTNLVVSLWAAIAHPAAPANVALQVYDATGTTLITEAVTGTLPVPFQWTQGSVTFNTGNSNSFIVRLKNLSTQRYGNDFIIDDFAVNFASTNQCVSIDTDNDGIPNHFDLDSDNDGCPDALEGGANISHNLVNNKKLNGGVDGLGIPVIVNGGQTIGSSENPNVFGQNCVTADTITIQAKCDKCEVRACAVNNDLNPAQSYSTTICLLPVGYINTDFIVNSCITFIPNGSVKKTQYGCILACQTNGLCDTTRVIILPPPPSADTIKVKAPCDTCSIKICPINDDIDTTGSTTTTCATPKGYTITGPDKDGCYSYKPNGSVKDTQTTCLITCTKDGRCDTTNIILPPPPPSADTVVVKAPCDVCSVTVCPINDDIDTTGATTTFCALPKGYTKTGPDKNGCYIYTPNGSVKDTQKTCIITCTKTGRCDTTVIILPPPPPSADTIVRKAPCDICGVEVCPINDDIDTTGATSTFCALPKGYTKSGPDKNGCYIYMPNGSVKDTQRTCIITCTKTGRCDTTVIILPPPPPSADTITLKPSCKTCGVTMCPLMDDIDTTGASVTYCTPPNGYTVKGPDANGCYIYTPTGSVQTMQQTCVIRCQPNGRCDTMVVYLLPPNPVPDTITIKASCDKCPVIGCPTNDDILTTDKTTTTICGTPFGYSVSQPDAKGCVTYIPNGSVKKNEMTCIITCDVRKRCDTTYIILSAPPTSPDTITVVPQCYNCSVYVCPVNDDIDTTGGKTTFSGEIKGYKRVGPDSYGCYTYTPIVLITKPDTILIITTTPTGRVDTTVVIFEKPLVKKGTDVPGPIPDFFSPNGDGVNDAFDITPIKLSYPKSSLKVYNRWGNVVYRSVGPYNNDWRGESSQNNKALPDGVYFYVIELEDNETKVKTGFIEIMR